MYEDIPDLDWDALKELGVFSCEICWRAKKKNQNGWEWSNSGTAKVHLVDADDLFDFLIQSSADLKIDLEVTLYFTIGKHLWLRGYDSSKRRTAPPDCRVFVAIWGRDCDGFSWRTYAAYKTFDEAVKEVYDILDSGDGPGDYCTLSCEQWEMAEYPEHRDVYAEAMGY